MRRAFFRILRGAGGASLWLGLLVAAAAHAHPLVQGAIDISVREGELELVVRSPRDEVLTAASLNGDPAVLASLAAVRAWHAEYFLRHIWVNADGKTLAGTVVDAGRDAAEGENMVRQVFAFALAAGERPRRLELRQDVLGGFEFAPGQLWAASYLVTLKAGGDTPAKPPALLISRESLVLEWAPAAGGSARLAAEYLRHGFDHILEGYDHLLFVTALALAAATLVDLVKVLSAFTLAHTVTLAATALGYASVPGRIVEPMIAASIVAVSSQNVLRPAASRGTARLTIVFFFGLFHGLGFAGGLLEAMRGMQGAKAGLAIASFGAGVEAGHLMVVVPVFLGLSAVRAGIARPEARERFDWWAMRGGSALIALAGGLYLVAALRAP